MEEEPNLENNGGEPEKIVDILKDIRDVLKSGVDNSPKLPLFKIDQDKPNYDLRYLLNTLNGKIKEHKRRSNLSAAVVYTLLFFILLLVIFADTIVKPFVHDEAKVSNTHITVSYKIHRVKFDILGRNNIDSMTIDSVVNIDLPPAKKISNGDKKK